MIKRPPSSLHCCVRLNAAADGATGVGIASPCGAGWADYGDRGLRRSRLHRPSHARASRRSLGRCCMIRPQVAERMVQMLVTGRVRSVDGVEVAVAARSICVHGDTPGAVTMAIAVRKAIAEAGIDIRAFAS